MDDLADALFTILALVFMGIIGWIFEPVATRICEYFSDYD